jgi:histone deacetylase complex regulatory component SIN3
MALFQDQPDLLLGFKDFLPEAQGLLNQLVPVMCQLISSMLLF